MNTIEQGVVGELRVAAVLMESGYIISSAMEGAPYDLIADDGHRLYRVQVKSVSNTKGSAGISVERVSHNTKGTKQKQYQPHEVDAYCIYAQDRDEVYWVPFDEAPATQITLRWSDPENGQTKGIRMAEDYRI